MEEILSGLNEAQIEAVTSTEGCVRVIAGAGSGKTRALSRRFAYLTLCLGVLPSSILCVTFTNKAANEMRRRIRTLTGDADTGYISTFHGMCVTILQEDARAIGYPRSFLVLDNADIDQMLRIIYEERGLTMRDMTFAEARDMIEIRKGITDRDYYELLISLSPEELKRRYDEAYEPRDIIFYGYLYNEKKCFALDYNDLLFVTLYVFRENPDIRDKWQSRLEYIMIDEFQDIDVPQYKLMRVLSAKHGNLFIVGDPDQTIYSWRGASARFLLDFEGAKTIMMMENYRSTPQIIRAANSLIDKNKQRIKKELIPTLAPGQSVRFHHAETAYEEAAFIAEEIKKLHDSGVSLSDIAVLYRAHYVTRPIEEIFEREELPYTIYSGVQFFERAEIKDALAYLRLCAYGDDLSFLRVANNPRRNLGEKRMRRLREYAADKDCTLLNALSACCDEELFRGTKAKKLLDMLSRLSNGCFERSASELLSDLLHESGYEAALRTEGARDRLDNLAELRQAVHEYEISCGEERVLESFLSHVALMTSADAEAGSEKAKLMTVHAAKGLEFPYVFIASMSETQFPSKKTATPEAMEEERRLCFVAMTRAEKGLYLTDSEGFNHDGSFRCPSRFVFDIDRDCIEYDSELDPSLVSDAAKLIAARDAKLMNEREPEHKKGDRVRHPVFGNGTVLSSDSTLRAYLIAFDELPTERKISWKVKLERIQE